MGRVRSESQLKKVDRINNWKKGRCHTAIRACIQDQTDKGLIWAHRKKLDCHTIAAFMNAYVRSNEQFEKFRRK
jgi:hypothetical protein